MDISVLVLWATVLVGGTLGQTCPKEVNDEIQRCVLPVARYAKVLNVGYKNQADLRQPQVILVNRCLIQKKFLKQMKKAERIRLLCERVH